MTDRQTEYDCLRGISCISVVIIHISGIFLKDNFSSFVSDMDWNIASFWRILTALAVPSFVMLSGAFTIKRKNIQFKSFYKKTLNRIIIPTALFSAIYVLMHYIEIYLAKALGIVMEADQTQLWNPILNLLRGRPHVTMWYMYMIIPLYLVIPIISALKESLSVKEYRILAVIMLFYGILVERTCSLSWILQFVAWIGYFMLGDVIREWIGELRVRGTIQHNQVLAGFLIIISYLMLVLYWYMFTYKKKSLMIPSSFSWIIICATLIQFAGFSLITIKTSGYFIGVIAKHSLTIYLMHPIFCEVYMQLFGRIFKWLPVAWMIPIYAIATIAVCIVVDVLARSRIIAKKHR